jgi:hypothetical protein
MDAQKIISLLKAGALLERVLEELDESFLGQVVEQAVTYRLARDAARELAANREAAEAVLTSLEVNLGHINGQPVQGYPFLEALLEELRQALA